MTTLYSNLKTATLLQKKEGGEFKITHHLAHSVEELVALIQNLALDSGSFVTPFKDVATLSLCVVQEMERLAFQIKTLKDDYDSLELRKTLDEDILFLHTYIGLMKQKIQTITDQQTKSRIEKFKQPFKLNLGSGSYPIDGWINIDLSSCDLPHNVINGLPFSDASVSFAYSSYLLEHLHYQKEAPFFIQEIHRVLKPGGVFRVCVPNIRPYMRAYLDENQDFFDYVEQTWGFSLGKLPLEKVLNYAGSGHTPGILDGHKFGYDDNTLIHLLRNAGFSAIYSCQYMKSRHDELRVDLDPLIRESYNAEKLTLIYECVKS